MERHTTLILTTRVLLYFHIGMFGVLWFFCILICLAFLGSTTVRIPDGANKLGPDER